MVRWVLVLLVYVLGSLSDIAIANNGLQKRYAVVGIISESKGNSDGIVMLLDRHKKKNLILKVGQYLTNKSDFYVLEVLSDSVIVSNGYKDIILNRDKFSQPAVERDRGRRFVETRHPPMNSYKRYSNRERSTLSDDDLGDFNEIETGQMEYRGRFGGSKAIRKKSARRKFKKRNF